MVILHQKVQCRSFCLAPNSPSSNICQLELLKQKAFVLNFLQMFFIHSPLFSLKCTPLLPKWWATRILEHWDDCNTQINIGKGGNHTSVSRFVTSIAGATYTDAITLSRLVLPRRVCLSPFQLTCSSAEEGISVRRISSPSRTSLAGTCLVANSSEPLSQESCYDRKLKRLLSDPASSLRDHPVHLRIHLAVFHISHIRDQHQTEGFSEDITRILLSATRASICACRFVSGTSLVPFEAGPPLLPRGSRGSLIYTDYAKKAKFSTTVTQASFCILST